LLVAACGTADQGIDPDDLEVRDLLGLDPAVTLRWGGEDRAGARRVLGEALARTAGEDTELVSVSAGVPARLALQALLTLDGRGGPPRMLLHVALTGERASVRELPGDGVTCGETLCASYPGDGGFSVAGWESWPELAGRGPGLVAGLAAATGHAGGELILQAAPRAPFVAAYVEGSNVLLVNPVVLAALEPPLLEAGVASAPKEPAAHRTSPGAARSGPNPYNFYGSVGECAAAERERCDACLPSSTCVKETRDATDGNQECTALAAGAGEGYFQLCANLSLAIASVGDCVSARAESCTFNPTAGDFLSSLGVNDLFLTDTTCAQALDGCLADLFGAPVGTFPSPGQPDGGTGTPGEPRSVEFSCLECDQDLSCNFSPSCGCSGGAGASCGGCEGGSCSGCDDSSTDGTSGGTCGSGSSCSSCDSGSSGGSGGSCGSCDSGSSSGSSCGSCDSGSSSSSSCDSCSGSSGGGSSCGGSGGDCGGDCGSGSCGDCGSGSCSTAGDRAIVRRAALAMTLAWVFLPLVVLEVWRRRGRRKKRQADQDGGDR
jgi:hypothetical protein